MKPWDLTYVLDGARNSSAALKLDREKSGAVVLLPSAPRELSKVKPICTASRRNGKSCPALGTWRCPTHGPRCGHHARFWYEPPMKAGRYCNDCGADIGENRIEGR